MIERYSRAEMSQIWDEAAKIASWAKVERAHLQVLCESKHCPEQVLLDFDRALASKTSEDFQRREKETGHDVIAFVAELGEAMGPESGPFLHRGLTSSDVVDTSLCLRLREALEVLDAGVMNWRVALAELAFHHEQTPMIGRTHGIHAEPISFGQVLAGYFAEASRAHKELLAALKTVSFGKLSGAVGSYTQLTPAFEKRTLALLGLEPEPVATQVLPRDRILSVARSIQSIVAVMERFALNMRHYARTELGEVLEPFGARQKGSSAMPHKKNPILSENLCGLARLAKGSMSALVDDGALWHERDISHSSVERVALPDLCIVTDFMLSRISSMTRGLDVSKKAMERNLGLTGGLWASGTVLTRLVEKGLERTTAYEALQRVALPLSAKVREETVDADAFQKALSADNVISARLTASELGECFSLDRFLKHTGAVFETVFGVKPEQLNWKPGESPFPVDQVPSLRRIVAVHVALQPDVLDTEARTIFQDMRHQIPNGLLAVRQNRTFTIELSVDEQRIGKSRSLVDAAFDYAKSVLCNEVMETLKFEVIQ